MANPSRKLPPISPKGDPTGDNADDPEVPRKRKKKRRPVEDESDEEPAVRGSVRRSPRRRQHPDSQAESGADNDDVSPSPRRPKSRARRQATEGAERATESRRKKRDQQSDSHDELVSAADDQAAEDPNAPVSARRKKKKKKKGRQLGERDEPEGEPAAIGMEAELRTYGLDDDIVLADEADKGGEVEDVPVTAAVMKSEPTNRIFIESKSGFKSTAKAKLARKRAEAVQRTVNQQLEEPIQNTTIQFALASHKLFKMFSLFCHGLFAGVALWQIIVVYSLSTESFDPLLMYYQPLAQPVQSMYYFLFAVCTVSAFDRYDVGRPNRRCCVRGCTMQSGAISAFFYFVGLVFSVAIAATDDKIALTKLKSTQDLYGTEEEKLSELNIWRTLNLIRGLCVMLGWLVISLRPMTDRLTKNLESAEENIIEGVEEEQVTKPNGIV